MSDHDRLADTIDYVSIRRVQNRYADIVTRRAWNELHEVMTPDCAVEVETADRSLRFVGPEETGEFIGRQLNQFSFFEFVILNTVIDIDQISDAAGARMYMQELRQGADGRRTNAYGVYHDLLRRDSTKDRRWRFARRRYQSYSRTAVAGSDHDQDVFALPVIALDEI